ncbi:MAG: hypothetical protein Q8R78_06715 [Candidatus Omnitrophota bacterium]|nr:hypothetical protein [Candidatus Omnitrophota bacterium]
MKLPLAVKPRVVLALVIVLAIGFKVAGKGMGRADLKQAPSGALAAAPTGKAQSLTAVVAEHLKELEAPFQSLSASPSAPQPSAEPLYTASALRDPLQSLLPQESAVMSATTATTAMPTPQPPEQPPVVALQGVFLGGAVPTAIINGKVYGIGDAVSGATIRAIDRRGIELEFHGATYRMTMQGTMTLLSRELPWR